MTVDMSKKDPEELTRKALREAASRRGGDLVDAGARAEQTGHVRRVLRSRDLASKPPAPELVDRSGMRVRHVANARELRRSAGQRSSAGRGREKRSQKASVRAQLRKMMNDPFQRVVEPAPRGWPGAGGGWAFYRESAPEWMTSSNQVCGWYPWGIGAGLPPHGVPLGRTMTDTRERVSCDPISWFIAGMILAPTMFILGLPGLGKSSLMRQIMSVIPSWGIIPIVMSDTRPDYSGVIKSLGGAVIRLGRGQGRLNPLDPGPLAAYIEQLPNTAWVDDSGNEFEDVQGECLAMIRGFRIALLTGLVEIARGGPIGNDDTYLAKAIDILDEEFDGVPVLGDLRELIVSRHSALRELAFDRGSDDRYDDAVEQLIRDLTKLGPSGPFGDTFAGQNTFDLDLSRPWSFDLSAIDERDEKYLGAVQLASWSYASTAIVAAKFLGDLEITERRTYMMFGDELYRPFRALPSTVVQVDGLIRMIRKLGIGSVFCTHTMADLKFADKALTEMAWGIVERSAVVVMGGLSPNEMGNLATVFAMSGTEREQVTSWTDQPSIDPDTGEKGIPPGRGKFLLKVGKSPGIAFDSFVAPNVQEVGETNASWSGLSDRRLGTVA